jgi:hypothetical protein
MCFNELTFLSLPLRVIMAAIEINCVEHFNIPCINSRSETLDPPHTHYVINNENNSISLTR